MDSNALADSLPGSTGPRHIPGLDGLRGLAIVLVVVWHVCVKTNSWLPAWTGVDLFFVLSGYLITGRLLATKGKSGYLSRFYRNRALRIFPLYYLILLGFFGAILFVMQPKTLPSVAYYTDHWKSFFVFTQNWTFARYGNPGDTTLMHLWSLAIEEQCYWIWPLLILLLPDKKNAIRFFSFLIVIIPVTRSIYYFRNPESVHSIFYNTFFRMDAIMTGTLLCLLHAEKISIPRRVITVIACILGAIFLIANGIIGNVLPENKFFASVGFTITAVLYALLLHRIVRPEPVKSIRIFNWPPLRFLGKISFGIYLIHFPLLVLGRPRILHWVGLCWPTCPKQELVISDCLCLLLTVLLGYLSYRCFESRFLRLKK